MPTWQRVYLSVCCAVIGFCLAYVLCDYSLWPRLTYFPYERDFAWVSEPPGPLPMMYLGTVLWGVSGAAVGALLGLLGTGFARRELGERWLILAGGWALATFAYAGLYYTWGLWPF